MKEFTTAAKKEIAADSGAEDAVTFKIDDEEIKAFRPSESQFILFMAAVGMGSTGTDGVAGVVNFLLSTLDAPSKSYIAGRLLDRDDPFGMDELQEIMEYLVEEWSGRPTESPSGSASSQPAGGQKSTPPSLASTSSELASTGS